jgi:bifunctional DNase/RNase
MSVAAVAGAADVEVDVEGVHVDHFGGPVVVLVEKGAGARELPIWVGPAEAQAIAIELEGVRRPRPLTHDLMRRMVEALGAQLDRVVVTQIDAHTFFAEMYLTGRDGQKIETLDARPSDAIALALRLDSPILVRETVFADAGMQGQHTATKVWGLTIQPLTAELAVALMMPGVSGSLVSDVERDGPARKVRRGDVITAVDDQAISSPLSLGRRLRAADEGDVVRLGVVRDGREVEVRLLAPGSR